RLSQESCRHRDQHTFPTRRSSDLEVNQRLVEMPPEPQGLQVAEGPVLAEGALRDHSLQRFQVRLDGVGGLLNQQFVLVDEVRVRSEEHTSELQSRENLVCRLLLEK